MAQGRYAGGLPLACPLARAGEWVGAQGQVQAARGHLAPRRTPTPPSLPLAISSRLPRSACRRHHHQNRHQNHLRRRLRQRCHSTPFGRVCDRGQIWPFATLTSEALLNPLIPLTPPGHPGSESAGDLAVGRRVVWASSGCCELLGCIPIPLWSLFFSFHAHPRAHPHAHPCVHLPALPSGVLLPLTRLMRGHSV